MKLILRYLLVLLLVLFFGCSSGQIETTEMKNDEAIIVARAFVNNNGDTLNTKWNFLWNERLWGTNAIWVEKDGYVFMKLPKGKHFIALLQYNEYRKNIPDNYLTVDLEGNKIYYIGDFTFNWNINKNDVAKNGIAGAVSDSEKNEDKIAVDIFDNYEKMIAIFNKKFGNTKPIEKQLLKIQ